VKRQAADRPDPRPSRADRTGQAWLSHGVPFLVVGPPDDLSPTASLHPIVWLETSGSVEARERDRYPEGRNHPWEELTYLERIA